VKKSAYYVKSFIIKEEGKSYYPQIKKGIVYAPKISLDTELVLTEKMDLAIILKKSRPSFLKRE